MTMGREQIAVTISKSNFLEIRQGEGGGGLKKAQKLRAYLIYGT